MNAHQLDANGVILNTIVVDDLNVFPRLVDAANGGKIGDSIINGHVVPAPLIKVVPMVVSPRQIRQAMTKANLRLRVENAVVASDQDTKDWYEFATEFRRDSPVVTMLAAALQVTDEQLDDLWILADSLT